MYKNHVSSAIKLMYSRFKISQQTLYTIVCSIILFTIKKIKTSRLTI